jgi:SpoVK/Ycf46/Vps4 family AAA+-type ATPase
MARSDLVVKLLEAASSGNHQLLARTAEAMISDERARGHTVLASRLESALQKRREVEATLPTSTNGAVNVERLTFQFQPERSLSALTLADDTRASLQQLLEEHQRSDLLRSFGLEPRHRVLLVGPPGNGKTSIAECLAYELAVPLIVVRYEGIIGSYLGETASRVSALFEYVRTRRCVLFFDEFDTISKERADPMELGEVKRVVSSLLLQIDRLPSYVLAVAATNHDELLDKAVWRRFEMRIHLPMPNASQRFKFVSERLSEAEPPAAISRQAVSRFLKDLSFAELENFTLDVRRRLVLEGPSVDSRGVVQRCLEQWMLRP